VIGVPLPMDEVRRGIAAAAASLGSERAHGMAAADAICTTDAWRKTAEAWLAIGGGAVRIGGMAKGAGMIRPDLGTMICILTTDLVAEPSFLDDCLREAVEDSFNAISVDGCCSTNDTVILAATGRSGIDARSQAARRGFVEGLRDVCQELAVSIVRDGEGARRYARWTIVGGRTRADARTVARAIAEDQLVRCALHGADPNWGRILCAAGNAGVEIVPEAISISIGSVTVFDRGVPVDEPDAEELRIACEADEVRMRIDLGMGESETTFWGSDLSGDYVAFNSMYTT
jgi:glutamate N-acetyltransferase/amino-acid N-acetyltransferase